MVSVLSKRHPNRLTNPALSVGLPAFLTKVTGIFSSLMLSQYTADTLVVEQRILSVPAFIQSIPTARALGFREFNPGHSVAKAKNVIRRHVAHQDKDRPLYPNHNKMKELFKSGETLEEAEKVVGNLEG
jgi:histidine ammonia-lyase